MTAAASPQGKTVSRRAQRPPQAAAPAAAPVVEQAPAPAAAPARPIGTLRSPLGTLSIKTTPTAPSAKPRLVADVKPLTQEDLEAYWREAADALGLHEVLDAAIPRLGEARGTIELDAQSVAFQDEFKPHRIDVMQFLRQKTGMGMLDCKVNPLYISRDEVIYSPEDKFKAMLSDNPALMEFRKLFPTIDY